MSCKDNLNQPIWAYITHVKPRRYLAVDVERGLVSGMFMFRHAGTESSYVDDKGKTVPFSAAMLKQQAVVISEMFKIEDGRIRRIEAVMTGNLDLDAPSGWGEQGLTSTASDPPATPATPPRPARARPVREPW